MTNREFFSAIISSNLSAEIVEFATNSLAKLDQRNEKRRDTMTKEQIANCNLKADILKVLTKPMVASEIASTLGISTQKVSALCKQLVDEGSLTVADIKVKNKGTVKQYELATIEG